MKTKLILLLAAAAFLNACAETTQSSEVVKADVTAHQWNLGAALTAQQQNNFWR